MIIKNSMISWEKYKKEINKKFNINFLAIQDLITEYEKNYTKIQWLQLNGWEDLDDEKIYDFISKLKKPNGKLYIITDLSYKKNKGPFTLNSSEINIFMRNYYDEFRECLFNGDLIIFSFEYKTGWLFHHEGLYALIEF